MKNRIKMIQEDEAKGMVQTLLVQLKDTEHIGFRAIKQDYSPIEEDLVIDCTAEPEVIVSMLNSQKYTSLNSLKKLEIKRLDRANEEVKQALAYFLRLV